eukprot:CAMPEP_0185420150 /NCGR_PEP_ID=MMETSP1365-20130426/10091_1 /TAXON_ID=38817 /ORGANISM="Gephyrocapsa oceanica, Strain RCC1303" /LENGTH=55 /DNA_ID=CAMNT_0028023763 /DNA_START=29 /DNA_END=194 /DNA_ORIENTATION=+
MARGDGSAVEYGAHTRPGPRLHGAPEGEVCLKFPREARPLPLQASDATDGGTARA